MTPEVLAIVLASLALGTLIGVALLGLAQWLQTRRMLAQLGRKDGAR